MGMIRRLTGFFREAAAMELGVYAANGAYFLVLALVPALGLIRTLPAFMAEPVGRLLEAMFPPGLEVLAGKTRGNPVLGIAAVWSASKGLYGLLRGLKVIYGTPGYRGWLAGRLLCLGYALGGLILGLAALPLAGWVFPGGMAPAVQTAAFWGLYLAASGGKSGVLGAAAGAVGASCGCMILTGGYALLLQKNPGGTLYGVGGGLLLVYLWAWTVLLGAFFHVKLWRK